MDNKRTTSADELAEFLKIVDEATEQRRLMLKRIEHLIDEGDRQLARLRCPVCSANWPSSQKAT